MKQIKNSQVAGPLVIGLLSALCATGQTSPGAAAPPDSQIKNWNVAPYFSQRAPAEARALGMGSQRAGAALLSAASPQPDGSPLAFVAITPCRVMDTRAAEMPAPFGTPTLIPDYSKKGAISRIVPIPQSSCGVPAAAAYSLNYAVIVPTGGALGWISAWPDDEAWPGTVVLNAMNGGIANNSVITPAGADGGIQVFVTDPADLVIDINGYFVARSSMNFKGEWSSNATYSAGDVVTSTGETGTVSTYFARAASQGVQPSGDAIAGGTKWATVAKGGIQGPAGPTGFTGATGPQGPAGPAGLTGAIGPTGQTGPAGLIGPMGPIGLTGAQGPAGPVGITYRTGWDKRLTYATNDVVTYNGSSYISVQDNNQSNMPGDSDSWSLLAVAGETGPGGPDGPIGPAGPAGAPGPFGPPGPIGPTGETGAVGPTGPAPATFQGTWIGATAYSVGDAVSFNGSTYISLMNSNLNNDPSLSLAQWSLLAQKGDAGAPGVDGAPGAGGPTGPAGATGAAGPSGPTGAIGPIGPAGTPGAPGVTGPMGPIGPTGPAGAGLMTLLLARNYGFDSSPQYSGFSGNGTGNSFSCSAADSCVLTPIPPSCTTLQNLHVQMIDTPNRTITWTLVYASPGSTIPSNGPSCVTSAGALSCNSPATASVMGMGTVSLGATWSGGQLSTSMKFVAYAECRAGQLQ